MPFIDEAARERVLEEGIITTPGDRCFVYYRNMLRAWRESPRWGTVHSLHKNMTDNLHYLGSDDRTAYLLAWDVFFALHVIPYEVAKRDENGEVE
jgi:hypothetical protein